VRFTEQHHGAQNEAQVTQTQYVFEISEGKMPFARSRHRYEDMGNSEMGRECVDWTHLAQDIAH
jgi:hypothetical protein